MTPWQVRLTSLERALFPLENLRRTEVTAKTISPEAIMGDTLADRLRGLGTRGVLVQMAQRGQIIELRCGGHLVPWNVRLSHVLCNREDYGWRMRIRRMLEKGMSLEEIAENLNDKGIRRPHGSATWSPTSVRKAFVS